MRVLKTDLRSPNRGSGKSVRKRRAEPKETNLDSRRRILDEAAALFSSQGYTETTLRQVAERVGMQPASVYYHFGSKDQIFTTILAEAIGRTAKAVRAAVEALPPEATPRARLTEAIRAHLTALHTGTTYTTVNYRYRGQVPKAVEVSVAQLREDYNAYWNQLLGAARAAGNLRNDIPVPMMRPMLLGTMNATMGWYRPERGNLGKLERATLRMIEGIWSREAAGQANRVGVVDAAESGQAAHDTNDEGK